MDERGSHARMDRTSLGTSYGGAKSTSSVGLIHCPHHPAVKKLKEINTIPVVIPCGCTSKVQLLHVSLNKPLKSYVMHYWSEYIMHKLKSQAPQQKIKPPTKADVAAWVSSGLKQLQEKPGMIMHSVDACDHK